MIENREKLINLLDEMIYTTKIETIDGMTHLTKVRKKETELFFRNLLRFYHLQ